MSRDQALLARYFRQLAELGGPDLFLDSLTAAEARALMAGGRAAASARSARTAPAVDRPVRAPAKGHASGAGAHAPVTAAAPEVVATLTTMAADAASCTRCRLHVERKQAVFGEGSAAADVVVVGEAPGQDEDRTGRPFVGRAGRMLDLLLMSAGYPRESVYICNVLKCRPPGNRNPLPDEMDACSSRFLHIQIETIGPRAILAVGRFAVQALLGLDQAIGRLRGRIHAWRGTPVIVSYHPAYLLRSPSMARAAWDDFQQLRAVVDEQHRD
ncbi:MAG: uracil-DNA glycosylase [Gemmatimonadetes bacterium]|nr:uracil-DNA glycosylase [Gemmatimonadota bacterium]